MYAHLRAEFCRPLRRRPDGPITHTTLWFRFRVGRVIGTALCRAVRHALVAETAHAKIVQWVNVDNLPGNGELMVPPVTESVRALGRHFQSFGSLADAHRIVIRTGAALGDPRHT